MSKRKPKSFPNIQLVVDKQMAVNPPMEEKEYPREIQRILKIIQGDTESVLKHLKREYNR